MTDLDALVKELRETASGDWTTGAPYDGGKRRAELVNLVCRIADALAAIPGLASISRDCDDFPAGRSGQARSASRR